VAPARGSRRREARRRALPLPVLRGLLIAAALAVAAVALYLVARQTSVFALRSLDVRGGTPAVKAEVERKLAPELGTSLLRLDDGVLARRLEALPDVVSVSFDRSFPHTLKVTVRAERPVLLVRQGARASWLVSSLGRVMRRIKRPHRSSLPRLWLPKTVPIHVGEVLPAPDGRLAAAALAPIAPGTLRVRMVDTRSAGLTLVLRTGPQIRLGGIGDLRLKLTIARRILGWAGDHQVSPASYIDVSVPERPVLGSAKP